MWCPSCQSDVAAEVGSDQRIRCATCSAELSSLKSTAATATATQDAREILARWTSSPLLDPAATLNIRPRQPVDSNVAHEPPAAAAPQMTSTSGERLRIDPGHRQGGTPEPPEPLAQQPVDDPPAVQRPQTIDDESAQRLAAAVADRQAARLDAAHHTTARPHFDRTEPRESTPHSSGQPQQAGGSGGWLAGIAQLLTYLGVGGLTVGAAAVIYGYFGQISHYLPLGWLILSCGQMLLFLGLITLVSVGLEQQQREFRDGLSELRREILQQSARGSRQGSRGPATP